MKKVIAVITIMISIFVGMTIYTYAANDIKEVEQTTTGKLIEIKEK